MKKLMISLLLLCACTIGANAQLLYKISGKGLKAPSYIIGTHHLAKTSFVDSIPGVKDALASCAQVYGELPWDDMMNPDSMKYMQSAMMLPQGQKLSNVLSVEQYQKLNAYLKSLLQTDLTNPMLEAQMGQFTPTTINTQLSLISYLMKHQGDFDPNNTIDQYFQKEAKKEGKPVGGLETVAFQTQVLLAGETMERQVELLMCFLDNTKFSEDMTEEMSKAFYAQDLKGIKEVMDVKLNTSCDETPEEEAASIDNRNADWLKKMPTIMAGNSTFFAVGAAHLPGEKGVLEGLQRLGYKVEGVK